MVTTRGQPVAQTAPATCCALPVGFDSRGVFASQGADARSPVRKAHLDEAREFAEIEERFEHDYPGMQIGVTEVDGDGVLHADQGGMKVFWLYRGWGEVFLPQGYRTQEGGSTPLPAAYQPDQLDPTCEGTLRMLQAGLSSISPAAIVHVESILGRWHGNVFLGDFPVELWNLEHVARPWAADQRVEDAWHPCLTRIGRWGIRPSSLVRSSPLDRGIS